MPTAALAHHALDAQFNTKETIALTGAVKRVDWSNPHVRLYIEVKDESNAVTWEVDMGSPSMQLRAGWRIDTYRHGDLVCGAPYQYPPTGRSDRPASGQ